MGKPGISREVESRISVEVGTGLVVVKCWCLRERRIGSESIRGSGFWFPDGTGRLMYVVVGDVYCST
jgi:hypothetical protein